MKILAPGKKNDDDVKIGRLEAEADIYDGKREDLSASERWRTMSKDEKIQNFKEYYLKPLIIGTIIFAIAGYFIYYMSRPTENEVFFAALFNVYFDSDDAETIPGEFKDYLGYSDDVADKLVKFKSYYDSELADAEWNNFYSKKRYDIFITNKERFKTYAKANLYLDLDEVLAKNDISLLSDEYVFSNNESLDDTSTEHAYGISLNNSRYTFYDEYDNVIEEPVAGIVINTKRKDSAIKFFKFILGK